MDICPSTLNHKKPDVQHDFAVMDVRTAGVEGKHTREHKPHRPQAHSVIYLSLASEQVPDYGRRDRLWDLHMGHSSRGVIWARRRETHPLSSSLLLLPLKTLVQLMRKNNRPGLHDLI